MDLDEALSLARSPLWSERCRSGQQLSSFAGGAAADDALRGLLLDEGDTRAIDATGLALIERGDQAAWKVLASVWLVAPPEQADHLTSLLSQTLFRVSSDQGEAARLKSILTTLTADGDADVRAGAKDLLRLVRSSLPA